MKKYFMFGVVEPGVAEERMKDLQQTYGEINVNSEYIQALGMAGPYLLTESVENIQNRINIGFDLALKYNIAISFQFDDIVGLGCDHPTTDIRYWEHPEMCEWNSFPNEGEEHGVLTRFWFNWGSWMMVPGLPCMKSEALRAFVKSQMDKGVLPVMKERYEELKRLGKEYLFAGAAMGWETSVQNMSDFKRFKPIECVISHEIMRDDEFTQSGYHALYLSGITSQTDLEEKAKKNKMSPERYLKEVLNDVQQDYTSWLCKQMIDIGLPKTKVFSHIVGIDSTYPEGEHLATYHPYIRAAVNPYCTPGFTLSPEVGGSNYDIAVLLERIHKITPDEKYFANAEGYVCGVNDYESHKTYLKELFDNGCIFNSYYGFDSPEGIKYHISKDPNAPVNRAILEYLQSR